MGKRNSRKRHFLQWPLLIFSGHFSSSVAASHLPCPLLIFRARFSSSYLEGDGADLRAIQLHAVGQVVPLLSIDSATQAGPLVEGHAQRSRWPCALLALPVDGRKARPRSPPQASAPSGINGLQNDAVPCGLLRDALRGAQKGQGGGVGTVGHHGKRVSARAGHVLAALRLPDPKLPIQRPAEDKDPVRREARRDPIEWANAFVGIRLYLREARVEQRMRSEVEEAHDVAFCEDQQLRLSARTSQRWPEGHAQDGQARPSEVVVPDPLQQRVVPDLGAVVPSQPNHDDAFGIARDDAPVPTISTDCRDRGLVAGAIIAGLEDPELLDLRSRDQVGIPRAPQLQVPGGGRGDEPCLGRGAGGALLLPSGLDGSSNRQTLRLGIDAESRDERRGVNRRWRRRPQGSLHRRTVPSLDALARVVSSLDHTRWYTTSQCPCSSWTQAPRSESKMRIGYARSCSGPFLERWQAPTQSRFPS
eukprot:scaffold1509_cov240-Pinguiococcus_pyrenoidosus.AAC.29